MKHKLSILIFVFVVMSLVLSLTFSAVSQEKQIVQVIAGISAYASLQSDPL
mgnify:CR=1 FL=1